MDNHVHYWQRQPEPITEFVAEINTDIVVIGAGIAGVVASHSAAEAGAEVLCVEKFGRVTAHGTDVAGVNSIIHQREGKYIDPLKAARLVYTWGQQQSNYSLIRTYTTRSGEMLSHYIRLMEAEGYKVNLNTELTARSDWNELEEKYQMFQSAHLFDLPEGSDEPKSKWNVAYLVRFAYRKALEEGAQFMFNTDAKQLIRQGDKVTGVIVKDADGYKKINASKGVIIATGGITDNKEMIECFCPVALRVDVIDNFPKGGNMGDGLVMGKWIGAAFSRCYPAPVIHPVNFTVLSPGMNSSWLTVNRKGNRFSNEMGYEPIVTNARMNAPGNVAYAIWDKDYLKHFQKQEPTKFKALGPDAAEQVEKCVENGEYFKGETLEELAQAINVPADNLKATVARYNEMCDNGEDVDFGVPERFLSPVKNGPFYACKISAFLLSLPYGLHVDDNSQVCGEDDEPIGNLFAVGSAQGDFFANSYPVTIPGSNHGRSVCFGRLVGSALAKGERLDGSKI